MQILILLNFTNASFTMTSVAAIREKFLQRDNSNRISSPSPVISPNGLGHSKHESSDRFLPQHSQSYSPETRNNINKFQKNAQHSVARSNHSSPSTIQAKTLASSKPSSSNASGAELGRSSSLTDLVINDNDKQCKLLDSKGSLSNSSDLGSVNSDKACVVSELKSLFENVAPSANLPNKILDNQNNNTYRCETYPKPAVLNLVPNSLILSLNSNHGESKPSNKNTFQKVKGVEKGSSAVSSSTSVINCAKARRDLSSISTSTSNLSGVSRDNSINEYSKDSIPSSGEGIQSDTSSMADRVEGSTAKKLCRRKRLLSLQELGPAPAKPHKPSFLKSSSVTSPSNAKSFSPYERHTPVGFNLLQPPKRPPPKPPSDALGKPLPPLPINEDIYDDSQNEENISLPELKEQNDRETITDSYSRPASNIVSNDELYHDIENEKEPETDDIYETMEIDPSVTDLNKSDSIMFDYREVVEERKQSRDLRDEKKDKEIAKIREKFKLTGDEICLGTGSVKHTVRARGNDLSVREGEKVTIYRMENNPSGKWLVINEKGKVGYVELSNIQIDPESIKTVMHTSYSYQSTYRSTYDSFYCDDDIYQEIGELREDWH